MDPHHHERLVLGDRGAELAGQVVVADALDVDDRRGRDQRRPLLRAEERTADAVQVVGVGVLDVDAQRLLQLDAVTAELLLERGLAEPRVAGHVVADLPLVDALGPGHHVRGEADHALVRLDGARHLCSLPLVSPSEVRRQ